MGQYLDYKKCKCRKKILNKLVGECSENIDENEMTYNMYSIICHIFHNKQKH